VRHLYNANSEWTMSMLRMARILQILGTQWVIFNLKKNSFKKRASGKHRKVWKLETPTIYLMFRLY
jgi:hypothetical protein